MIYIYPIWKMGRPFAAGITGAAHIIPGYIDERWFDPSGSGKKGSGGGGEETPPPSSGGNWLQHPLGQKARVTSPFNDPSRSSHKGTDMGALIRGKDCTIYAVADGEIISSGFNSSMGNHVFLRVNAEGKPHVIVYMHLKDGGYLPGGLKTGSKVTKGQTLGIMGNTGDSEGIHLHLEVCVGSTRVRGGAGDNRTDPEVWFKKHGVTL